jgi:hypothetical protein
MALDDLQHEAEDGVMDLDRQARARHAECRVVGDGLALAQAQQPVQRQGIRAPPRNFPL